MEKIRILASLVVVAPLLGVDSVAAQEPSAASATVAVLPFSVEGYVRDPEAIARSADAFGNGLRQVLERDSSVRILHADSSERPIKRDATRPPAAHHIVLGTVVAETREHVLVRWRLIVVESGRVLAQDSLRVGMGEEHESAAIVAQAVIAQIQQRHPSPY